MKTILVPTDFSDCANRALNSACFIARKTKAEIVLLHVLQSPRQTTPSSVTGNWKDDGETESEVPLMMGLLKATKKKMKPLISSCAGVKLTDVIETGVVSEEINIAAKKYKADLIVMGTHGASGLKEVFVGSNASHVVRDAEIPVITINDGETNKIETVIFATDFSEETNLVLPFIKSFAEIFSAQVHLLKIITDSSEKDELKKQSEKFKEKNKINDYPVSILHHLQSKEEGIKRFAELMHADIIAVGTHGRHGLARFFKGSIAENVVNSASVPVLAVNFHKKLMEPKKIFVQQSSSQSHHEQNPDIRYSTHTPFI